MKKISIIVGAYNAHSTLAKCLTSLHHKFDYYIDGEIIYEESQCSDSGI